ncbi:MAG: exosortase/archaeosortase family protein [Terriglobales bacterium]
MTRLPAPLSFVLLCAVSLMMEWRALAATLSLALNREEYTHILLVMPIAAALIFLDRHVFRLQPVPGAWWGSAFCFVSAAVAALAKWGPGFQPDTRLSLSMLALVLWWAGAFVLCFGTRVAQTFLFPLGFLLWMVPIPSFMLAHIITFLQRWSAFSAQLLFSAVGVPVSQDGFFLTIPGLTVEVAKECSSIRSSLMLVVTTMVLAQLQLRSPWRKLLLVAVAVPLSVAKNGLRIFTIAMLSIRVDRGFMTGRLHRQGGIVFLLIALPVVFLLLWVLRKREQRSAAVAFVPVAPLKSPQH